MHYTVLLLYQQLGIIVIETVAQSIFYWVLTSLPSFLRPSYYRTSLPPERLPSLPPRSRLPFLLLPLNFPFPLFPSLSLFF